MDQPVLALLLTILSQMDMLRLSASMSEGHRSL